MADLYHFSTKEDSYASYFIRVSPVCASPTYRVDISWGKKAQGGFPLASRVSPLWQLLEIQAQYHRQSLGSLDSALAELKESHRQTGTRWLSGQPGEGCEQPARLENMFLYIPLSPPEPSFTADAPVAGYYGVPLETHLRSLGREIALPIEACVMMLLASGMREEVGSAPHPVPCGPFPQKTNHPTPHPFAPSPGALSAGGRRLGAEEAEEQLGQRLQRPGGVLLRPPRRGRWVTVIWGRGMGSGRRRHPLTSIAPAAPLQAR